MYGRGDETPNSLEYGRKWKMLCPHAIYTAIVLEGGWRGNTREMEIGCGGCDIFMIVPCFVGSTDTPGQGYKCGGAGDCAI